MAGRGRELKGSAKEAVGGALGNERMRAEGAADKATGKAARETAGTANAAAGTLKQGVGKALGSERLHAEGASQKLKGKAQRAG